MGKPRARIHDRGSGDGHRLGVLGTAVAAIAWFISQVGQDVPAG